MNRRAPYFYVAYSGYDFRGVLVEADDDSSVKGYVINGAWRLHFTRGKVRTPDLDAHLGGRTLATGKIVWRGHWPEGTKTYDEAIAAICAWLETGAVPATRPGKKAPPRARRVRGDDRDEIPF